MDKPHIYKITNNVNGKFYYGVHNGSNTDTYMGSGVALKKAQNKYGLNNFSKEILLWFDTVEEAYEYEAVIVNEKMVKSDNCYNLCIGGYGARGQDCSGEKNNFYGKSHSKESKDKISSSKKGQKHTESTKVKIRSYRHTDDAIENISKKLKGIKRSDETRKKMSDIKKIKVECPHCGKVGSSGPMKQWHFNNCKHKR